LVLVLLSSLGCDAYIKIKCKWWGAGGNCRPPFLLSA